MRSRLQIASAILLLTALVFLIWSIFKFREPVYRGKRLGDWVAQYGTNYWSAPNGELAKEAESAIRQIGTNAIPFYLRMLTAKESTLKLTLLAIIPRRWQDRSWRHTVDGHRQWWAYGLIALGSDAKLAVPSLIALLNETNASVRCTAVFALGGLGSIAGDAIVPLVERLNDRDFMVRNTAIMAVGRIRKDPERVIPGLIKILEKPRTPNETFSFQYNALWSLQKFGAEAKPANTALLPYLNDTEEVLRSAATNALKAINPEAAAKAGIK